MPAADPAKPRDAADAPPRLPVPQLVLVALLLAAPVIGLLWVSSYNCAQPRLGGVPFFYWYQFLWVFIAAATTSLAYRIVVRHERRRRGRGAEAATRHDGASR